MTRPRKKWKLAYTGSDVEDHFDSEKATFEFLRALARSKAAGGDVTDEVTVWVDEGGPHGWQKFEVFNMLEMAAGVPR